MFKPAERFQTMHLTFEEICQGEDPWIPLGNFMHWWYGGEVGLRPKLIVDPLGENYPLKCRKWAAFCAASVRWFCSTYELPCPSWVDDPQYVLSEPWYMDSPSSLWDYERKTTAPEFIQHNIYCGNRVYTNKYERDERGIPLQFHPVDLQERRALVRMAAARLERERVEADRRYQELLPILRARLSSKVDQSQVV